MKPLFFCAVSNIAREAPNKTKSAFMYRRGRHFFFRFGICLMNTLRHRSHLNSTRNTVKRRCMKHEGTAVAQKGRVHAALTLGTWRWRNVYVQTGSFCQLSRSTRGMSWPLQSTLGFQFASLIMARGCTYCRFVLSQMMRAKLALRICST